jgi:pimeloyl-ACP methyl ester carboxylesterase
MRRERFRSPLASARGGDIVAFTRSHLVFHCHLAVIIGFGVVSADPAAVTRQYPSVVSVHIPSNGAAMKGRVFLSRPKAAAPTVLLLHGWPGSTDDVLGLGALLSREGVTAVTFNPRGMHGSEGTASFAHALEDIRAALEWLRAREVSRKFGVDTSRIVLAGHSWGGGLGLAYAARDTSVRRIVAIAPNDHAEFVREYKRNPALAAAIDKMVAETTGPAGPVRFDPQANGIAELSAQMDVYGLRENASRLADRNILIVGGWEDESATVEQYLLPFYRALKRAGAANATFLVYHDGHNFVRVRERLARDIREWVLK